MTYPAVKWVRAAFIAVVGLLSRTQAQTLVFNYDPTTQVVTSISAAAPITFTTSTSYTYSGIQVRLFDLYPTLHLFNSSSLSSNGLLLSPNSSAGAEAFTTVSSPNTNLGGSAAAGDVIMWYTGTFSFSSGQSMTVIGTADLSPNPSFPVQLLAPPTGTYQMYLASQWDGSLLSNPVNVSVVGTPIPEPAMAGVLLGTAALAMIWHARRNSPRAQP